MSLGCTMETLRSETLLYMSTPHCLVVVVVCNDVVVVGDDVVVGDVVVVGSDVVIIVCCSFFCLYFVSRVSWHLLFVFVGILFLFILVLLVFSFCFFGCCCR